MSAWPKGYNQPPTLHHHHHPSNTHKKHPDSDPTNATWLKYHHSHRCIFSPFEGDIFSWSQSGALGRPAKLSSVLSFMGNSAQARPGPRRPVHQSLYHPATEADIPVPTSSEGSGVRVLSEMRDDLSTRNTRPLNPSDL